MVRIFKRGVLSSPPLSTPENVLVQSSRSPAMPRPIMDLQDEFNFGKHAGSRLEAVIDFDPGYIEWLIANNVVPFTRSAVAHMDENDIEMTGA